MNKCIKFRPFKKNTLLRFCDLSLTRVGITIKDCCWHAKAGKEWVSFPAKSYLDKDGCTQWSPVVERRAQAVPAHGARRDSCCGRRGRCGSIAMTDRKQRPVYLLRIQQTKSDDDVRLLRWALKRMLRQLGWRALSVERERPQ
jgi:hypothetical protein